MEERNNHKDNEDADYDANESIISIPRSEPESLALELINKNEYMNIINFISTRLFMFIYVFITRYK